MASVINKNVKVKLDGKYVGFRNVEIRTMRHSLVESIEIKLTSLDGDVIYDDGSRIEVIFEE